MTTFSYTSGDPANLVAGESANMRDIAGPFSDITTFLNGNIDATNLATSAKPVTLLTPYRMIYEATFGVPTGIQDNFLPTTGSAVRAGQASPTSASPGIFYFNPADYAVTGLSTKLRIYVIQYTFATAPNITYTFGLYPLSSVSGGSASLVYNVGTVITGSTVARAASATNTTYIDVTSDFDPPSTGTYVMGCVTSSAAAGAIYGATARLEYHHV